MPKEGAKVEIVAAPFHHSRWYWTILDPILSPEQRQGAAPIDHSISVRKIEFDTVLVWMKRNFLQVAEMIL